MSPTATKIVLGLIAALIIHHYMMRGNSQKGRKA